MQADLDEGKRCPEQHFWALDHDAIPDTCCGLSRQDCGEHSAEPFPSQRPKAALKLVEHLDQAGVLAFNQNVKHPLLHIQARSALNRKQLYVNTPEKQNQLLITCLK